MKIYLFMLTFLFVLGPVPNTPLGIYFDTILIISLFVLLFHNKKTYLNYNIITIKKLVFFPLIYIISVGFFASIISDPSISSLNFIQVIMRPIKIIITFFGALYIVLLYREYNSLNYFNLLCKNILLILVINGSLMILQLIFPSVDEFIKTILFNNVSEVHYQSLKRVGGMYLSSGGAIASIYQGMALLFIPYLFKVKEINFFSVILFYIIILISIIITGRSGLIILPISMFCFFYFSNSISKFITITSILIFLFFLNDIVSLIDSYVISMDNDMLSFNFNRFLNLFTEESTVAYLIRKFTIPQDVFILLFGSLNFNNYEFTDVSDMGWNISLYKYGLFGYLFYYSIIIGIFIKAFNGKYIEKSKVFLFRIFIITYLIFEFKEEVIYARNGLSIFFLLTIIFLLLEKKSLIKTR